MGVLENILAQKRLELPQLRRRPCPAPGPIVPCDLKRKPDGSLRILAEIKKRSPSAGPLSTVLSVEERAAAYERGGASMLSVLCDAHFFGGDYEDLRAARQGTRLPLLCKEFILDEVQLDCARSYGASAALLIVRCLDVKSLARLHQATLDRGLLPLVEVASHEEAAMALDVGATTIGVNARDLDTLQMQPERAQAVLRDLPNHITKLHLSGVKTPEDVRQLLGSPADGALVGEILMREDSPEPKLRSLVEAARPA